ncbi:MAG: peptidylprolyl isomerase [Halothece sp. Uz-M2-17]|nr:peptidylprolyl isomerase [Halothece sp. Uz-M2-17]
MLEQIKITQDQIFHQAKLSGQIPNVVKAITETEIINATAQEKQIETTPEELQKAADTFRAANQLTSADETWKWLDNRGLTIEDFEEMIHNSVLRAKLASHLFADQVESYFFENKINYTTAIIYEICVEDEDLAMELFYAIQEGEANFHELAHQYVPDPEQRRQGGYRGVVNRKQLNPELSAPIFAANPPQVLKPILTSTGAHLIFVEELIEPELSQQLSQKILSDLLTQWLNSQLEKIEVFQELSS